MNPAGRSRPIREEKIPLVNGSRAAVPAFFREFLDHRFVDAGQSSQRQEHADQTRREPAINKNRTYSFHTALSARRHPRELRLPAPDELERYNAEDSPRKCRGNCEG